MGVDRTNAGSDTDIDTVEEKPATDHRSPP
jgi:hypothetical protein